MADRTTLEVMDEFHKVAGKVASGWASVESLVEAAVWEVLGLESPMGRVVTRHMRFGVHIEVLSDLLKARYPEKFAGAAAEWGALIQTLDKLRVERNAIVHGNWGALDQYQASPVIVGLAYQPKHDPVPKAVPFTLQRMEQVEESITRSWFHFMDFVETTFDIHPKPPEVSMQQLVDVQEGRALKDQREGC